MAACCGCSGECLDRGCACYRVCKICSVCCANCRNRYHEGRLNHVENDLHGDITYFTRGEDVTPAELECMQNFAVLTSSVDSEEFPITRRTTTLGALMTRTLMRTAVERLLDMPGDLSLPEGDDTAYEEQENFVARTLLEIAYDMFPPSA